MASSSLNKNNSAVKRIMQEARELGSDPSTDYAAGPLEDDIFEWHCTLRGPAGTEFEGGLYHVRIMLPAEYPFRPPSLMVLTPNGRFELNTKICISFTSYHEELWQPAWGVRTAIIGLQGFFPLKGQAAVGVGSIEYPAAERKRLAALSREWVCPHCKQSNLDHLPDPVAEGSTDPSPSVPEATNIQEPAATAASTASTGTSTSEPSPSSTPNETSEIAPNADTPDADIRNDASPPQPPLAASSATEETPAPIESFSASHPRAVSVRPSLHKPPLILDGAICVILVLVFALVCRRMF